MNNMKIQKLVLTFFAFGIQIGCGGISPGEGPGFPESITARQLFTGASQSLYLTDAVPTNGESMNETYSCEGGGSVTINANVTETGDTVKVTYTNCEAGRYIGGTGYQLKINGVVELSGQQNENSSTTSFKQSMSFGGDLGFAATCDYSLSINEGNVTYQGDCTYEDSEGKRLNLDLEELNSEN